MLLPEKFSEVQEIEGTNLNNAGFQSRMSDVQRAIYGLELYEKRQVLTECLMVVMKLIEDEKRKLLVNQLDPDGSDL